MDNLILATDSYKLGHWNQYPKDTQAVYSYFESRKGAKYDQTVFFGLQYIIKKYLLGTVVTNADVSEARKLATAHFGNPDIFNFDGWKHIVDDHEGKLPIIIKAVQEGTVVPVNNVLMTVENTCEKCFWLTNALESLLTHVWYSSTVATVSWNVKQMMKEYLERTSDSLDALPFMLHDFGYRGASSHESAAIGGAGHLLNFMGTDTLPAMLLMRDYYSADLSKLAFSVPATEHSVMTAEGLEGEMPLVERLIGEHPNGILSVVADSYNIYDFVGRLGRELHDKVMARDGVFVVRPDSVTPTHDTPAKLVVWILHNLYEHFGGHYNEKNFKVLDPHVRVLWGDGIDPEGISEILHAAAQAGFSAENLVFGMGGGLLQKVNRDTQRFAFKCSARLADGQWIPVQKNPLDKSKASKKGRLALVKSKVDGKMRTLDERLLATIDDDELKIVYKNGYITHHLSTETIRLRTNQ